MTEWARQWGINLKGARRLVRMTQRDLAAAIGVSQPTVARWEAGLNSPSDAHKVALATALNQDVRALFPLMRGAA